jgi:hypothetical protein
MTSPNNNPNQNWTDMVAASRKEVPSPVDVRHGVRAELESMLRTGTVTRSQGTDWINALVSLFNPGIVKLGLAAAFICMLAVDFSISTSDVETESDDPLVSLYSGEGEWSDWL